MGENSKIIVVANQKGGVGKSTVCMALANYLAVEMKFRVGGIIDTDFQNSVQLKRDTDLKRIAGTDQFPAYEVTSFNLDNYTNIPHLIEELRKQDMIYIFDTPGRLDHPGLVPLIVFADYIIVPFNYQDMDLTATIRFLMFINNLREKLLKQQNYGFNPPLYFLPMVIDNRIGTAENKEYWAAVRAECLNTGTILPQISYLAKMQSVDTIKLCKKQKAAVTETFNSFIQDIYSGLNSNQGDETDGNAQS